MALSRRDFLKLGGLTAVAAGSTACSVIGRNLAQDDLPQTLTAPTSASEHPTVAVNPARRILDRAGYGPQPGDVERVSEMGLAAYVEEQLNPEAIDDGATDLMLRNLTLYRMDPSQLVEQEPRDATVELIGSTLLRKLYSQRQLYEAMVEFWSDHFNIYLGKNQAMPLAKIIDDRDVIRPYALGKFGDLLRASAKSPAMLLYLDNVRNEKSHPNENYARELMELHTLGVDGGYTQRDVQELARILTGWTVARRGLDKGQFVFNEAQHDFGEKVLLGRTFPAGRGVKEVEEALAHLAAQPATANFIATKLARRFVADDPPQNLVAQVAQTYRETDGDVRAMLRDIFLSEEFVTAPPKLKRPFTYFVSALRALHTDLRPGRGRAIADWLRRLGQVPFNWPPPDGYPDVSAAWTANLLPRWNLALALLHEDLPGATPPLEHIVQAGSANTPLDVLHLFSGLVNGRPLQPDEIDLFTDYVGAGDLTHPDTQARLRDSVALMLAGPEFQWT